VYDYYIGKDGIKICVFCYHFCCQNLISKEELDENRNVDKIKTFQEYNFRSVHLTKEEFEYGLIIGDITCDCLNLINSKHRSQEHLSMFINQLNIPLLNEEYNIDYFSELTPVHLVNKFFNCIELFENIYNGFISEYDDFLSTKESNIHQNLITHNFSMGYFNFANNAKNCKYNFYFSEKPRFSRGYYTDVTRNHAFAFIFHQHRRYAKNFKHRQHVRFLYRVPT
jgi:hypothetical protein